MEKNLVVIEKMSIKRVAIYLLKSILAGIMIAIGGTIYLSMENKILGAFLFAIGLFIIVSRELNLYTGKLGYIFDRPPKYLIEVITTIIGNFIGAFLFGLLVKNTRIYVNIKDKAEALCSVKLADSILSILLLSAFCGILMYLAVDGYKKITDSLGKNLGVFLGVVVFILSGFEHSIANMYYFTVGNAWNLKGFSYMGIMIIGNLIGGVLFPLSFKLIRKLEEKKSKGI